MASNRPQLFNPLRFVELLPAAGDRQAAVAKIAYFIAQQRGFVPGHDLEDWLAAEAVVDQRRGFER